MKQIEVNNRAESPVEEGKIKEIALNAAQFLLEREKFEKEDDIELSIAFVDKQEIRKLNRQYRKKDESTDVLSFSYDEGLNGEIILCYNIIKENSHEDGTDVELELGRNIIHGMLHILGHEHGKEMFKIQDSFISQSEK